jgi:hypothetical protein
VKCRRSTGQTVSNQGSVSAIASQNVTITAPATPTTTTTDDHDDDPALAAHRDQLQDGRGFRFERAGQAEL